MPDAVVVLGAGGFVGRHLVPALRAAGYSVLARGRADASEPLPAGPRVSHVVNLAGRTFVPESWDDPVPFYQDNVVATAAALRLCRHAGAALVHVSSYVYGPPQRLPIDEDHPLVAVNPYAHSKILAEEVVAFHRRELGVRAAVLRPFNLYGPGQPPHFLIPAIVRQVADPACAAIEVADPAPRRDYLHVRDFVALIGAVIAAGAEGTWNAGSGTSLSVAAVAELAQRAAGTSKPLRVTGAPRPNEIADVVADIARARDALAWQPHITLESGISELLAAA